MRTLSHKTTFLNQKNIPYKVLSFGLQIERRYYDHNLFNYYDIVFLDATFIINC